MSSIPKLFGLYTSVYEGFNTIPIVQEFIKAKNSKCEILKLRLQGAKIEQMEVEKLIKVKRTLLTSKCFLILWNIWKKSLQILNNTEKTVTIYGTETNTIAINTKIGMYSVQAYGYYPNENNSISFTHICFPWFSFYSLRSWRLQAIVAINTIKPFWL